ncbi:MAG: hypothetical protein Q7U59_08400 [Lutibacter sp.]|nr:hypothetical protein [Lutibacter sp.]
MITTKKHLLKFYLPLSFAFLFFVGFGSLMIYMFLDIEKDQIELKTYFKPAIGIGFIFMAFSLIIQYVKNSPKISVDKTSISFNNEKYRLDDIKNIILTGKMPFKYLIKFPMEGAFLEFKDGTEKYIFNDMYSNTWQIKSFLEKTVIEKKDYKIPKNIKIDSNQLRFEQIEEFKGIQWTSLRGLSLWGLIGFFLFLVLSKNQNPTLGFWLFISLFGSFWFFMNSWLMHFFGLTRDFLVIKNHNLIWKQHIFRLEEIKEVVFETQGKMPNCLRVITKDFKNKLYPAGTLRDNTWLEFKISLEKRGIKVRNECI